MKEKNRGLVVMAREPWGHQAEMWLEVDVLATALSPKGAEGYLSTYLLLNNVLKV